MAEWKVKNGKLVRREYWEGDRSALNRVAEDSFPIQEVVAALRAAGWTCCPPGAEEVWAIENAAGIGRCEGGLLFYESLEEATEQLAESDERAVRYVRCEAPGTAKPSATGQGGKG